MLSVQLREKLSARLYREAGIVETQSEPKSFASLVLEILT